MSPLASLALVALRENPGGMSTATLADVLGVSVRKATIVVVELEQLGTARSSREEGMVMVRALRPRRAAPRRAAWLQLATAPAADAKPAPRPQRAASVPPPPPSTRRALPVFEEGVGDRHDDCSSYVGCLARWNATRRRRNEDRPARCPSACAHRTARDHRADVDHFAGARNGAAITA